MTYRNAGIRFTWVASAIIAAVLGVTSSFRATRCDASVSTSDAVMVAELHRAMIHVEDHKSRYGEYPETTRQLTDRTSFDLSPGIRWKAFRRKVKGDAKTESVWMAISDRRSDRTWFADYPARGTRVFSKRP